ncbi:hypothetical protein ACP4OV_001341 [Aristida adscensionis]
MEKGSSAQHKGEKEALMGNGEEEKEGQVGKKEKRQRKEKKEKKGRGHSSDGDRSIYSGSTKHGAEKEQAEVSAQMTELISSEHAEGSLTKSDVKKDKKKKKENKKIDVTSEQPVVDAANENVRSGHEEMNRSKGEHDSKTKKGKRKCEDGCTASDGSAGDQIGSREGKKRRKDCSVTLEEGNQIDMAKNEEKRKGKKKTRKESDHVGQDRENELAAEDSKNVNKANKMGKDESTGDKRVKEKAAHRKDKGKRVSFTDSVEVFTLDDGDEEGGDASGDSRLVHGKRFTPEEDAKLMEAIMNYAEMKQLGEKGIEMIRESIKHPELKGCWAEIATSLPHRPMVAIYKRARILLYRSAERKWTEEEYEIVRRFVEKNGTGWKKLATELGKSDIHVKDTWRRMKPKNLRKGAWSQDEYQNLFDLVNLDLRVKAHQKIDPGHRLLRDNISWEAISDKLTTRSNKDCCLKWYQQLTSQLVKEGVWADTDDYLLVEALQKVDAVCIEDIDWESLLEHRSGELCRQRWNQMVRMIGGHREKPFIEQVEVLSRRYCPEMLDYRKGEA